MDKKFIIMGIVGSILALLFLVMLFLAVVTPIIIEDAIETAISKLSTKEVFCGLEQTEGLTIQFEETTYYCIVN